MIHPQPTSALLLLWEQPQSPPYERDAMLSPGARRRTGSAPLRRAARALVSRRRTLVLVRPAERASRRLS
jgi:hypothetical protein